MKGRNSMSTFLWIVFIYLCIWVVIESHQKKKQNQKADTKSPVVDTVVPCEASETDAEETE